MSCFPETLCKRRMQRERIGKRKKGIDPYDVPILHEPDRFFRRHDLIHSRFLHFLYRSGPVYHLTGAHNNDFLLTHSFFGYLIRYPK